jgi:Na+/H+ antiporter NhaD/arsenite permease-like protein
MRIALFSDVHANFPALAACLKSIDQQGAMQSTALVTWWATTFGPMK